MIEIEVKGNTYNLFDNFDINTSLDNMTGGFSFTTTPENDIPVKVNDAIKVFIDGTEIINGFIEKAEISISPDSTSITYSGRDVLGDLIDSSVPDSVSVNDKSISLEELCNRTIRALSIKSKVVNLAGTIDPFSEKEIEAVGFGGKAAEFLQSFARKRGLFLTTDGKGALVIFTPPTELTDDRKLTFESMTTRSTVFDNSQRFNVIRAGSQDNNSASDDSDISEGVSRSRSFIDEEIRPSRYLEITAEESMNNAELSRRAQEEANIRRARGFGFNCDLPGHDYFKGNLIKVDDELTGVIGTFLIRSVDYSQSLSVGNESKLTLCYPESYSAVGKRTSKRKSKMGVGKVEEPEPDQGFLDKIFKFVGEFLQN